MLLVVFIACSIFLKDKHISETTKLVNEWMMQDRSSSVSQKEVKYFIKEINRLPKQYWLEPEGNYELIALTGRIINRLFL